MSTTGIIITEGPDACGKSTLQDYFVNHFEAVSMHLTYPAPLQYRDMFDYQWQKLQEAVLYARTKLVIVDRHWISEMIYAKVFRGGSPWPDMPRIMSEEWAKNHAVYILCVPYSFDDTCKRHRENLDPNHPYDDAKFTELLIEYQDFAEENISIRNDMMTYMIEEEGTDLEMFCEEAIDFLFWNQTRSII